ncbi:hypothetical protein [Marinomonas posidonica]|uniref:Lipoprotein n=1 Tax=Marinomonas posidonica (strain CECT 7376 / NCIMB 14433 / IVIA-Po-181) TaxID=491952 RepID=F6CY52_MARPP|nr:hypothetical protein [Marinomonas posidonica]AEF55684.1 hypothetical protein Mar181_2653 [Marinomonas posidonica IVIA-Po-181]
MGYKRILLVFTLVTLLIACEQNESIATDLNNLELRTQWRQCLYDSVTKSDEKACQQYQEECEKRQGSNNFACY